MIKKYAKSDDKLEALVVHTHGTPWGLLLGDNSGFYTDKNEVSDLYLTTGRGNLSKEAKFVEDFKKELVGAGLVEDDVKIMLFSCRGACDFSTGYPEWSKKNLDNIAKKLSSVLGSKAKVRATSGPIMGDVGQTKGYQKTYQAGKEIERKKVKKLEPLD